MKQEKKNAVRDAIISIMIISSFISAPLTGCKRKNVDTEKIIHAVGERKDSRRKITVIFGGDVMQHMPQIKAAYRDSVYDFDSSFAHLKPVFDSADLVIVNLEGTLSETGPYSGYPRFRAPASLAKSLKACGVTAVMLANNHICDKGGDGIRATVKALDEAGLLYTGTFPDSTTYRKKNPLYFTANGFRLAIFNYTYGTNGLPVPKGMVVNLTDTSVMAADYDSIDRDSIDHIITFLHWGEEYSRSPNSKQRELAEWCRRKGSTIIAGSHPHVIQPVLTLRDTNGKIVSVTAYSLGNLISNQRWRHSNGGLLLKTELSPYGDSSSNIKVSYIPVWVYKHYRDGRREYEILPPTAADTILSVDKAAKEKYEEFIEDTEKLLTGK